MLLSYSNIPNQYLEPLNVETEIEYNLDNEKFPGLKERDNEPALVVASSKTETKNAESITSTQTTNLPKVQEDFSAFVKPQLFLGSQRQQVDSQKYERLLCQSGVQRRLSYESAHQPCSLDQVIPQSAYPRCQQNPMSCSLDKTPPSVLRNVPCPKALSCLDPFDDSADLTRNDGTSSGFSTPSSSTHTPDHVATKSAILANKQQITSYTVTPPETHLPMDAQLARTDRRPNNRHLHTGHIEIYGVEGARNFRGVQHPIQPIAKRQPFVIPENRKRPRPEDSPTEDFDEYSCPVRRKTEDSSRPQRRHTIHYYGPSNAASKQHTTSHVVQYGRVSNARVKSNKMVHPNVTVNNPAIRRQPDANSAIIGPHFSQPVNNQVMYHPISSQLINERVTNFPTSFNQNSGRSASCSIPVQQINSSVSEFSSPRLSMNNCVTKYPYGNSVSDHQPENTPSTTSMTRETYLDILCAK